MRFAARFLAVFGVAVSDRSAGRRRRTPRRCASPTAPSAAPCRRSWVAQEGGYFKREGLDTELLYIGGGSLLIQSMLSGDVPFAYGPSVPVINASLRGSDLGSDRQHRQCFGVFDHVAAGDQAAGAAQRQKSRRDPPRRLDRLGVGRGA